jgi:hypothetical protein
MKVTSIAPRPYGAPGSDEWENLFAIPGPFERVRRVIMPQRRRGQRSANGDAIPR